MIAGASAGCTPEILEALAAADRGAAVAADGADATSDGDATAGANDGGADNNPDGSGSASDAGPTRWVGVENLYWKSCQSTEWSENCTSLTEGMYAYHVEIDLDESGKPARLPILWTSGLPGLSFPANGLSSALFQTGQTETQRFDLPPYDQQMDAVITVAEASADTNSFRAVYDYSLVYTVPAAGGPMVVVISGHSTIESTRRPDVLLFERTFEHGGVAGEIGASVRSENTGVLVRSAD